MSCNKLCITYYSLDDAINSPIDSKTAFIIANERYSKSTGRVGRSYTVFSSAKLFFKNRAKYPHCHEILVDHFARVPNLAGRLVFDFDIKYKSDTKIPKNFKKQIQKTVGEVVEQYFHDVDTNLLEYVWSSSKNTKKLSKHLTVKNLYFDNWVDLSKIFYKLFCEIWDTNYAWIKSDDLIDFQIVRNRASLRMVGSSKIGGNELILDNNKYQLTDSLIRIYFNSQRKKEQLVTKDNINPSVLSEVLSESSDTEYHEQIYFSPSKKIDPAFDNIIYDKAYELFEQINKNVFRKGKINGKFMSLLRKKVNKQSKCLISGKKHEHENAFLDINETDAGYSVSFGCYRFCGENKRKFIGLITKDNHIFMINPEFD